MKRWWWISTGVLALAIAVLAILLWIAYRRPAPHGADLLPAGTIVFVRTPDFEKSRTEIRHTAAYALWNEPEVQEFLTRPLGIIRESLGANNADKFDKVLGQILKAPRGEAFAALVGFDLLPFPRASVVCGVDVKLKLLETRLAVANLERNIRNNNPDKDIIQAVSYLGKEYHVWRMRDQLIVCQAFLNSMIVFTIGEEPMRDIIARHTRRAQVSEVSLAGNQQFQSFARAMPANHDVLVYVNPKPVYGKLGPLLALSSRAAGIFEELFGMEATGMSITFSNPVIHEVRVTLYRDNFHQPSPAATRKSLALTSPQTVLYHVRNTHIAGLFDRILTLAGIVGRGGWLDVLRQLAGPIRNNVLQNLGGETALIVNWRDGAELPDVALVAEISDRAGLRAALDLTMDAIKRRFFGNDDQSPWDTTETRGYTLHIVRPGAGKLAPTYVATEQFLIITSTPDFARDLLAQAAGNLPTLTAKPDYQKAMTDMPDRASAYTFCDLRALYPHVQLFAQQTAARMADQLVRQTTGNGLPATTEKLWMPLMSFAQKLPPPAAVTPHLFPFVTATVDEANREITISNSPFGTPVGLMGIAAITILGPQAFGMLPRIGITPTAVPKTSSSTAAPPTSP